MFAALVIAGPASRSRPARLASATRGQNARRARQRDGCDGGLQLLAMSSCHLPNTTFSSTGARESQRIWQPPLAWQLALRGAACPARTRQARGRQQNCRAPRSCVQPSPLPTIARLARGDHHHEPSPIHHPLQSSWQDRLPRHALCCSHRLPGRGRGYFLAGFGRPWSDRSHLSSRRPAGTNVLTDVC